MARSVLDRDDGQAGKMVKSAGIGGERNEPCRKAVAAISESKALAVRFWVAATMPA